jgi:hypothetical protein
MIAMAPARVMASPNHLASGIDTNDGKQVLTEVDAIESDATEFIAHHDQLPPVVDAVECGRTGRTIPLTWAMDFVHDQLATSRKLRVLTIVNTFSRFSPALEPRFTFRGVDVVEVLERVGKQVRGPVTIRVD